MSERPISGAVVAKEIMGRSPAWFYAHRLDLEAVGFPRPIPVHGGYLPSKVRAWLDRGAEPEAQSTAFDRGVERLANGRRKRSAA